MMGIWVVATIVTVIAMAVAGGFIGARRGRPAAGFFLGLILGPIGWVIVGFSGPAETHRCRKCGGVRVPDFPRCMTCGWEPGK
jgi:hypothetical protein